VKRFIIFILIVLSVVAYRGNGFATLVDAEGVYTFYLEDRAVRMDSRTSAYFATLALPAMHGQSVSFEGGAGDVAALIERLGVEVFDIQILDNHTIYYGYTRKLRGGVAVDDTLVNIQIAIRGGRVTVGTPLILGSF
jgi:hypothetical protein